MPNDTTLQSVFDYAKQTSVGGGDNPKLPVVFATFVEHSPNSHPPGMNGFADLVIYANGPLTLSQDKQTLSGEFKIWRNQFVETFNVGTTIPGPPDAFADINNNLTLLVNVSASGQATYQKKLKGKPIGGLPPAPLKAVYDNGLFVEKGSSSVRSLSFSLGF